MASDATRNIRFDDVRGMHVLVALSGGADSVALLKLLCMRREEDRLTLTAAHLHHGIRGAQADGDAAYCRELCRDLGVPLLEEQLDIPALARKNGQGLETAAREARYIFLRRAKLQAGADVIALAHHMDDQAETVLMHLFRGAGPDGMRGMDRLSGGLYRPLLETPKEQLVQFLREEGISWREDATNAVPDNPRNAIRLHVLPEIEKSYPMAAAAAARYARLARIEGDFLDRLTDAFLKERLERGPYGLRFRLDGSEEEAILRRALRKTAGCSLPAAKLDALVSLAGQKRGRLEISGKLRAERTGEYLYLLPPEKEYPALFLRVPGETLLPGLCRIVAEEGSFPMEASDPFTEIFDADALAGAVLRTRRNADRIHPLGAPGEKLLSDYLTDRKIDRPLRSFLPLIAVNDRVLWACGVGMGHEARIRPDTLRMVRLRIYFITEEKTEVPYDQ